MKKQFSNGAHAAQMPRYRARYGAQTRSGFTLVEILVVLVIIAILAAILLPVFNAARETSKQASCTTNLQQIGLAVRLYEQDEKKYPSSLAFLLPQDDKLGITGTTTKVNGQDCTAAEKTCPNPRGTGYLKSPKLLCPDDDTVATTGARTSYGDVSTDLSAGPKLALAATEGTDAGRYVWNYWGYKGSGVEAGFNYTEAEACGTAATPTVDCLPAAYIAELTGGKDTTPGTVKTFLRDPSQVYSATNLVDPRKVPRMANRNAPERTIIAHCVFHRVPTSSNLAQPQNLYPLTEAGANSKDIVLRLDGSAAAVDVTAWEADPNKLWATQPAK